MAIAARYPDDLPELARDARLARLLSEDNTDLFEYLGAYQNLGFARGFLDLPNLDEVERDEVGHRYRLIYKKFHHAAKQGLLPVDLDLEQIHFIARALGGLPYAAPVEEPPRVAMTHEWVNALQDFVERHPISLRDLAQASDSVQITLLLRDPVARLVSLEPLKRAWRARLAGGRGVEDATTAGILDRTDALVKGDFPEMKDPRRVPPGSSRQWRVKYRRQLEDVVVAECLNKILIRSTSMLADLREIDEYAVTLKNPVYLMDGFHSFLEADLVIDRGLNPVLRQAFSELILGQKIASGPETLQRVRQALHDRLSLIRHAWRRQERAVHAAPAPLALVTTTAAPDVVADRATRVREYQPRVKVESAPVAGRQTPEPPRPRRLTHEMSFWEDLADPARSLEDARAVVRERVRPDQVYEVPLNRSGFRYRVQFSAALLDQLLDPRAGEPRDPRAWWRCCGKVAVAGHNPAGTN